MKRLKPTFVDLIPDTVDNGTLYISVKYGTMIHRCCCGCGNEVVTPLSPTDWRLTYDGEHVSIDPSIGNWGFPCQSHYWVRKNAIQWAPKFSKAQVAAVREEGIAEKKEYYGDRDRAGPAPRERKKIPWWKRLWDSVGSE